MKITVRHIKTRHYAIITDTGVRLIDATDWPLFWGDLTKGKTPRKWWIKRQQEAQR